MGVVLPHLNRTDARSVGCFDPNRSRAPTAIASRHQSAARRRTRSASKRGASCRTTTTRSRRGRPSEYSVNLGGHDEVVLMQSLDLLGLQRDRRIAPTEADIRMMAFGFRGFTNLLNKGKRLAEIAKPKAPLDAVSFLRQLPVRGLCVKELSLLAREWRCSSATGSTGFASKSFGHVACPSCQPSSAPRLANCESDVAISANQAIERTVITAAAAPGWISWADLGSGTHTARALSASITRAGIWREVLEFVRLPLPLLRVGRGRFFDRNVWPDFRVFRIQQQPFLKPRLGIRFDRVDRAFRHADPAIDAFIRVDDEHVLALVEAVHGAHVDAVHDFAANTALVDDEGQLSVLSADRSGELIHGVRLSLRCSFSG